MCVFHGIPLFPYRKSAMLNWTWMDFCSLWSNKCFWAKALSKTLKSSITVWNQSTHKWPSSDLNSGPADSKVHVLPIAILYESLELTICQCNGTPLQYSCLENPMDGGAWWAAVHWVAKSRTRLSDFTFMPQRRKWKPTPVFLPGESQGRGSLVGCCLWGHTESDTTEVA